MLTAFRDMLASESEQVENFSLERGISAEENAAALMRIHLDGSLATRNAHESGWWTSVDGFFHPAPPWEAPEHRRDGR